MEVNLVFSTDPAGCAHPATVGASILRRTEAKVNVLVYTTGFEMEPFCSGPLTVDFVRCDEVPSGRYPAHASPAAFNRLRIIHDGPDWDRVLVMDHDMLVFCDLGEYFREPFDGNLLLGRIFAGPETLGDRLKEHGELPAVWEQAASSPFFHMGPMLNLHAMREESLWTRFWQAHEDIGRCEHIPLALACAGRIGKAPKKWNLVPDWDEFGDRGGFTGKKSLEGETIEWCNGVPKGLVHWTGRAKPWHYKSHAWRADLWGSEQTNWETLRLGLWRKPTAYLIGTSPPTCDEALIQRGWRVTRAWPGGDAAISTWTPRHPDHLLVEEAMPDADLVRFHAEENPVSHIATWGKRPNTIIVEGPRGTDELDAIRSLGYPWEARIVRREWPAGGPHPAHVSYGIPSPPINLAENCDLYLSEVDPKARRADEVRGTSTTSTAGSGIPSWLDEAVASTAGAVSGDATRIMLLGSPDHALAVFDAFRPAKLINVSANWNALESAWLKSSGHAGIEFHHAPLSGSCSWHDLSNLETGPLDAIVVCREAGAAAAAYHPMATSFAHLLAPRAAVLVVESDQQDLATALHAWEEAEFVHVHAAEQFHMLTLPAGPAFTGSRTRAALPERLEDAAGKVYVISLPDRTDRRLDLERNWRGLGLGFEIVEGVVPDPDSIRWREMKGMEGYGKVENLRGDYIIGAVGCKRAGIRALRTFLASGAPTALICQDDCRWSPGAEALISKALRELPVYWDLLYFSASARQPSAPRSQHLIRLRGARLCTAVLWRRETAELLLPQLEECDCEWDVFMQRSHHDLNVYCVHPMPAYQARSRSDITRRMVQPMNA